MVGNAGGCERVLRNEKSSDMKRIIFILLLLGFTLPLALRAQTVSILGGGEAFSFRGSYDSEEIFQKKGLYYTQTGSRFIGEKEHKYKVTVPQKMQGYTYIFASAPPVSHVKGDCEMITGGLPSGFSYGNFIDGRKDGSWVYVTFATPEVTVREEYRMGKLLSRKPGPRYPDAP
jgi:hypothetical protein